MLAMHYRIPLADAPAVDAIRRRAAERGPLFDGMPGLAHKYFLADAIEPTYATFYLWREADAALAFLRGPFFAALSETFGRPRVRLMVTTAIDPPAEDPREITMVEGVRAHAFGPRIDAIDPDDGAPLSLRFDDAVRGRRFALLYHARGDAAFAPPRAPTPRVRLPALSLQEF